MSQSPPHALVMGGSLGGLTAALFLRRAGCRVSVFERSPAPLTGQGAGIVLHPATVRFFRQAGHPPLEALSVRARWLRYLDDQGRVVAEREAPYRFAAYNALYQALLQALGPHDYHLNAPVVGLDQDDATVSVQLGDGRRVTGDFLVCADGIRSQAAQWLLGDRTLEYAGYIAWRGTVPETALPGPAFAALAGGFTYYLMPDGHFLVYPIRLGRGPGAGLVLNWLWYRNVPAGPALDALMTGRDGVRRDVALGPGTVAESPLQELRADARARLPARLADLVRQTETPFIQAIVDGESPRLAFGRACLLGDAAFVARPHVAAGTAKATEDGWQLGQAFRASGGDIPAALSQWEPGQLALGRLVVARARAAGRQLQSGAWPVGRGLPFGLRTAGDSALN